MDDKVREYDVLICGGGTAGAVAALGVKLDLTPSAIPLEAIYELLEEHEAIVPTMQQCTCTTNPCRRSIS